jgi:hypothetical protein
MNVTPSVLGARILDMPHTPQLFAAFVPGACRLHLATRFQSTGPPFTGENDYQGKVPNELPGAVDTYDGSMDGLGAHLRSHLFGDHDASLW